MKSNKSIDKEYEEEVKFTELSYNHEETLRLENTPLYIKYKNWLRDNGVIVDPRIRYPSYFGSPPNGIVGISAMKPIEKAKAIIAVPYQLLITVDKVRENKDLNTIITNHFFSYGKKDDIALKILILFVVS